MAFKNKVCEHLLELDISSLKTAKDYVCEECIKTGSTWMHLRTCQECGITLCCDSSPNKHASKHYQQHSHKVVISAEPQEKWAWCYEHKSFLEY